MCIPPWTCPSSISFSIPTVKIGDGGCRLCSVCEAFDDEDGREMFMTAMPKADGNEPVHPGGGGADGDINAVTACLGMTGEAEIYVA